MTHDHHEDGIAAPNLPSRDGRHGRACRCWTRWCRPCRPHRERRPPRFAASGSSTSRTAPSWSKWTPAAEGKAFESVADPQAARGAPGPDHGGVQPRFPPGGGGRRRRLGRSCARERGVAVRRASEAHRGRGRARRQDHRSDRCRRARAATPSFARWRSRPKTSRPWAAATSATPAATSTRCRGARRPRRCRCRPIRASSSSGCSARRSAPSSAAGSSPRTGAFSTRSSARSGSLQKRLGAADTARVNEYLDSVREVERRVQKMEARVDRAYRRCRRCRSACPISTTTTSG